MLAFLAIATIIVLLGLILSNRTTPLVALVIVPVAAAIVGGFGLQTTKFMLTGITSVAPVTAMFVFSILFFGIMTDAGVMEPVLTRLLRMIGQHPTRVVVGSAALALLVHLDGSGAVCFLVVIPAMLPLYTTLGIDKRILACVTSLAAGVNFLPWTGPTIRASAALHLPVTVIFRPLWSVQLVGLAFAFSVAYMLGQRETRRLRTTSPVIIAEPGLPGTVGVQQSRSNLRQAVNGIIIVAVLGAMVSGVIEPAAGFMVGTVLALVLNFPNSKDQQSRVEAHARAALLMAGTLMAAGVFTGIMSGSGMLQALSHAVLERLPAGSGRHIPVVLGLISMPLSLLFDPDSYYLGVMPVLAQVTERSGGQAIAVAQASLLGVMTTGFPVSPLTPATFLVTGLTGVELSVHQKFTGPYLLAASVLMTVAAVAFGVIAP